MHEDQWPWRHLYNQIHEKPDAQVYPQIIQPWLDEYPGEAEWLKAFSVRAERPWPAAEVTDLWRLFAASMVFETLALGLIPGPMYPDDWTGPCITPDEFRAFAIALGFTVETPVSYSPFNVEVTGLIASADDEEAVHMVRAHWPCLMLGPMLFMRCGAIVRAPATQLRIGIADEAPLYWAYTRKTRPVCNRSQGWGSNSRWRTAFRRDYRVDGVLHFNVDAPYDLATGLMPPAYDMDLQQCREIVINRSFVITDSPSEEMWPYDFRLSMPV